MHDYSMFIVPNSLGVLLMCTILIASRHFRQSKNTGDTLFLVLSLSVLMMCLIDMTAYIFDGREFQGAKNLNFIFNSVLFLFDIVPAIIWAMFVNYKIFNDKKKFKKVFFIIGIPEIIMIICVIINIFYPIVFSISEENIYHREVVGYFPFAFMLGYFLYTIFLVYFHRNRMQKYLIFPIISFLIMPGIGAFIQIFTSLSATWVLVAYSVVILYLSLQDEALSIDRLTGLYNLTYLNKYITKAHKKNELFIGGIMMDMDKFKSINDLYGHSVGDDALMMMGEIIHAAVPYNGCAIRYAGDEFVVVLNVNAIGEIKKVIQDIKSGLKKFNQTTQKPYRLNASFGFSLYRKDGSDSIDDFLKRIDNAMYEDKKTKKYER